MKNFLSKYWKRILILITGIFIIINIVSKIATPRNVISDVAKYGPDVEASNIGSSSLASDFVASSPVSGEMTKLIIILVIGLLVAVIIADLGSKKGEGKKK